MSSTRYSSRAVAGMAECELAKAMDKFPRFNSPHEGWAVIYEELDELKEHVWGNTGRTYAARDEAIQIAAMAMRYVHDLTVDEPEGATSTASENPELRKDGV